MIFGCFYHFNINMFKMTDKYDKYKVIRCGYIIKGSVGKNVEKQINY